MMIYDINGKGLGIGQGNAKSWKDNGALDAVSVTKQLCNIEWTTTASGMPNGRSGTLNANVTTKGMPYSSASVEDGYIGIGISLYTFMSALYNPNSVLYAETSKGYTGFAYYGTVCTSLVCAAWGLPCLITTVAFPKTNLISSKQKSEVELGDMLLSSSHAKLVTGIKRDTSGNITHVKLSESTYNHCIENEYQTYSNFVSNNTAYTVYRYKHIDSVDSYKPIFLPLYDEELATVTYPDVMTYYGDKVTRKRGTDIPINVLNSSGYTSIQVYRCGELIDTKTSVADFTISDADVGDYEVRLVGASNTSSTFFDIVDATISVSGSTLTYSTTYGATAVGGYPSYTTDSSGKATTWNNPKRVQLITEEEDVARTVDITDITNDSDCDGGVRLYVRGIYGSVSFEYSFA